MAFPSESSLKKELESMAFPSGSTNLHSAEGGKSLILDDDKTNEDDKTELSNFSVDSVTGACTSPDVSESNDLSNLAWLSTVDVQQELQKVSQSDQGFQKNYKQTPPKPTFTASSSGCVVYGSTSCSTTDPAQHLPHNGMPQPRTRFTPIQPNLNNIDTTQQQQPYFLHHPPHHHHQQHHQQQQRNNQQLLQPMQQPMVDRTSPNHRYNHYRPYPPPPYTAGVGLRAGYDNFHHIGRYHRTQQQRVFPKPVYSYSCLIAMSLRKSKTGALPVSDIYSYMMENFPYFKTAPDGWKNSVRHNLSLNKCFEKVEKPNGSQRKGCLWALNPAKASKMEEELQKWKRKDPESIRKSMSNPDEFDREIEELRRADEETARRRMLSMSGHGLSIPFFHPHLHPGGSSSLPSTPHHYHHPPPHFHMRQSTTPTHRYNPQQQHQQVCGYPTTDQQRSQHPPRQLFAHMQQHNMDGGGGSTGNSLPQPSVHEQPMSVREQPISVHDQPMTSGVESLHPTLTSDASGFLSALENNGSSSGHPDLTDLESSLTDLSAFQGVSWDEAACALASPASAQHDFFDEQPTSSSSGHRHPSSTTTELSTALSDHGAGEPPPSNGANADSTYGALARFAGDFSYITTNSKTVMLH